jgi:hypothetical protein
MKTYFLAWETDNKNGHCIYEFEEGDIGFGDVTPQKALNYMIALIQRDLETDNVGNIRAKQFNNIV